MITCDEALELLSAALDGPLTAEEQATLDAHLAQCQECRALQADFSAMHAGMEDWEVFPPPPGLTERIMAEVHASKVTPLPRAKRWRSWAGLAAVCAVALLGAGPLHLWLSPDSQMSGGAAPTSEIQQFDSMTADLQEGVEQGAPESVMGAMPAAAPIAEVPYASDYLQKSSNAPTPTAYSAQSSPERILNQEITPQSTIVPPTSPSLQGNGAERGAGEVSNSTTSAPPLLTAPRMATPPIYCGSFTLPYGDAPELSAYTRTIVDTEWYYTLPAQDFFALVEAYQDLKTAVLTTEGSDFSADASEGIVILTDVPSDVSEQTP